MKTSNLKKLAVGLVVMIGAFTVAPVSQAETLRAGAARISVAFSYDPNAAAERIYSDLHRVARNACKHNGDRLMVMRLGDKKCVAEMIDSGVAQFGRADIAELHKGRIAVANR